MQSNRSPVWLYAHPSMEDLAQLIAARCTGQVRLDSVNNEAKKLAMEKQMSLVKERRLVEYRKTIRWDSFHDGFPNLFIEDVKDMAGKDVIFLASFHSPEVIFEQLSIIYAIPRYLARSFTLILPLFPTGTMERVDKEGQIATAKTLTTLLSTIPLTARGPAQIMIYDIHALQERFYFSETVIPRLETAVPLLLRELKKLASEYDNNFSVVFPDDGAHKRFGGMFENVPLIICAKVRDGMKRIVKVKEGDAKDRHCVIVDDLVQTGGTLIESAKALKTAGALTISCYVTHAIFPKESWKKFINCEVPFQNFWITDSVPHATKIAQHAPFKMLSLCDTVADTLLGFDLLQ